MLRIGLSPKSLQGPTISPSRECGETGAVVVVERITKRGEAVVGKDNESIHKCPAHAEVISCPTECSDYI